MFNEKNPIWIKIFKIVVIVLFFISLLSGLLLVMADVVDEDEAFLAILGGIVGAFVELCIGMLAVNYLSNVQRIREILEEKHTQDQ